MKSFLQILKNTSLEIGKAVLVGLGFAIVTGIALAGIPFLWLNIFFKFGSISIHLIPIIILSIIAFLFGFRYGLK